MAQSGSNEDPCPTIGHLKACLLARHGCRLEDVALFIGADNEDGPRLVRMVGPSGFIPDVTIYPDSEPATPSTIDYFCRTLGVSRVKVHLDGPAGRLRVDVISERVLPFAPAAVLPITGASGTRRRRKKPSR